MDKSIYDDTKLPIFFRECKSNPKTPYLIIALTSHGAAGRWYEFYKVLDIYDKTHQLFMSSIKDKYYLTDIGSGWNEQKITELIKEIIELYNIKKIITLGNSAGGTGSIVWGYRCAEFIRTSMIAGAPFNSIKGLNWNLVKDIISIQNPPYKDNFCIYVDENHEPDFNNVQPLLKYINHVHVPNAQHNISKTLYLSGKLFEILNVEIKDDSNNPKIIDTIWNYNTIKFEVR